MAGVSTVHVVDVDDVDYDGTTAGVVVAVDDVVYVVGVVLCC